MKNTNRIVIGIFVLTLSLSFWACQEKAVSHQDTHSKTIGMEYSSAYVCPMHCEGSGSEQAGNCSVCGMDYVKHADHTSNGHSHEIQKEVDSHEGHDH